MIEIRSDRNKKYLNSGKKLLACYILAGYPNNESFMDVLAVCNESNFDILEIGFPSNDPYYDGAIIAAAHQQVMKDYCQSKEYWAKIRSMTNKPIWIMGYKNDLLDTKAYLDLCQNNMIDGIVIPDITNKDRIDLASKLAHLKVDVIGFANPNMEDIELNEILSTFPIIYEQLYVGQTGCTSDKEIYHHMLEISTTYPDKYILAGFGINTCRHIVKLFKEGFSGAIIGTGIIKELNKSLDFMRTYLKELGKAKEIWE